MSAVRMARTDGRRSESDILEGRPLDRRTRYPDRNPTIVGLLQMIDLVRIPMVSIVHRKSSDEPLRTYSLPIGPYA